MKLTKTEYDVVIEEGNIADPEIRNGDGMTDLNREFQEWIYACWTDGSYKEPVPEHLISELKAEVDNSMDIAFNEGECYLDSVGREWGYKARRVLKNVWKKLEEASKSPKNQTSEITEKEFHENVCGFRNWFWNNGSCPKAGFRFVAKNMRDEFPECFDSRRKVIASNKVIRDSFK